MGMWWGKENPRIWWKEGVESGFWWIDPMDSYGFNRNLVGGDWNHGKLDWLEPETQKGMFCVRVMWREVHDFSEG